MCVSILKLCGVYIVTLVNKMYYIGMAMIIVGVSLLFGNLVK